MAVGGRPGEQLRQTAVRASQLVFGTSLQAILMEAPCHDGRGHGSQAISE